MGHDEVVKIVKTSLTPGSTSKFQVQYTNPNDKKVLEFSISPRTFRRKTDEGVTELISEQVVKQLNEFGYEITLNDILGAKVEIKTTDVKKPEEKKPGKFDKFGKKPDEKKPGEKKPEEKK